MKLKEGKFYRTRGGRKVGPMQPSGYEKWPWIVNEGDGQCWHDDGTGVYETDSPDLIAEWQDEPRPWKDLTPEEKGALLLASYEGKVIEQCVLTPGIDKFSWLDVPEHFYPNPELSYRIKPEPKRETVEGWWDGYFHNAEPIRDYYRITFDLVDGVPDCASIKMENVK